MFGTKVFEERKSKYNGNLRVVRSFGLGTYIQADGLTQSGGIVETFWRQTLKRIYNSRPSGCRQFTINNCLILGLGGGTVAKLVKKNWKTAKVTGVDIDPLMIELGEKYLKFDRSQVEIKIGDALQLSQKLKEKGKKFDLIIIDLYNGDQFPKKFEDDKFISLIRMILPGNGVAIFNRLYYKDKKIEAEKFGKRLQKVFKKVEYYRPVSNLMLICYNA